MSATRSRKEDKTYKRYLRSTNPKVCSFCSIDSDSDQLVRATKHFKIIKNIFPYSLWDGQLVSDHLMITPVQHTDSLANMTDRQKVDYVNLIEQYEQQGYNIYARAPSSAVKSIYHQHTHLIKCASKPKRFILLLRKPYFRMLLG